MFSLKIKKKGICRIIIGGIVYSRQIMLPKNASMLSYEEISVLCFYKSIYSMIPLLSKINCIADLFYMITHWYITMAFRNRLIYTYVFIPAFNLEKIRSCCFFIKIRISHTFEYNLYI